MQNANVRHRPPFEKGMVKPYIHDKSDRTVRKHLVCHMLSSTILPTRCLSIRKTKMSLGRSEHRVHTRLLQCALDIRLGHTIRPRLFHSVEQRHVPLEVSGPAI